MRREWIFQWNVQTIKKSSNAKSDKRLFERNKSRIDLSFLLTDWRNKNMWILLHDWKLENMIIENNRVTQDQLCIYLVIRIWCFFLKLFRWRSSLRSKSYSSFVSFFIYYHSFFFIWFFLTRHILSTQFFLQHISFHLLTIFIFFARSLRYRFRKWVHFSLVRSRWCTARQSRSFSSCIRFSLLILSFTFSHRFCSWYVLIVLAMTWLSSFRSTVSLARSVRR